MKLISFLASCFMLAFCLTCCKSGLVTMSNGCYNSIEKGKQENKTGNHQAALETFNDVLDKCKAFDAKEQASAGKAAALNGLKRYDEALTVSSEALKYKNNSIDLLFEKATAELGLGRAADAKGDLLIITDLTQRNQNTAQRAGIYAKMAEIDIKQQIYGNAITNANQAIMLDPANTSHYMVLGDAYSAQGDFDQAKEKYETAILKGKDDSEAWKAKLTAIIKSAQKKYKTTGSEQLAGRMTSAEKQSLCDNIKTAQAKGVKDMNIDLLQVSLCK